MVSIKFDIVSIPLILLIISVILNQKVRASSNNSETTTKEILIDLGKATTSSPAVKPSSTTSKTDATTFSDIDDDAEINKNKAKTNTNLEATTFSDIDDDLEINKNKTKANTNLEATTFENDIDDATEAPSSKKPATGPAPSPESSSSTTEGSSSNKPATDPAPSPGNSSSTTEGSSTKKPATGRAPSPESNSSTTEDSQLSSSTESNEIFVQTTTEEEPDRPSATTRKPSRQKSRTLADLLFSKKPIYEELLHYKQRHILNAADDIFSLKYTSFPVKKASVLDTTSAEEAHEIKAFEMLSALVGRSVRQAITCSWGKNRSIDFLTECAENGIDVDMSDKFGDKLCPFDDPETLNHEDCLGRHKSRDFRGQALHNQLIVYNTGKNSPGLRLAPTGNLREAIDKRLWNRDHPTKIILSLLPYEFLKTKFINEQINQKLISAFQERYSWNPHNIIEIQWPEIFPKRLSVVQLASRFLATADQITRLILRWNRKGNIDMNKLHIIGFSLGAHMAGVIGNLAMTKRRGAPIGRITALDPIGWGFDEGVENELELTKDDALFVDVIHTSSPDPYYPYFHYGSKLKRGIVDFYPNNGRSQYCAVTDGLCHHFYSVILYAASITEDKFDACKCTSWNDFIMRRKCTPCLDSTVMGEHVNKQKAKGVYYLVTA